MAEKFKTSLVGRRFTSIPPRTKPNWHVRDDLPQGIVYLVHTAFLDEGVPTVVGERIDVTSALRDGELDKNAPAAVGDNGTIAERFNSAPQSATVAVTHFGVLWELLPA